MEVNKWRQSDELYNTKPVVWRRRAAGPLLRSNSGRKLSCSQNYKHILNFRSRGPSLAPPSSSRSHLLDKFPAMSKFPLRISVLGFSMTVANFTLSQAWCVAIHGVANSRTWLNDWTTTTTTTTNPLLCRNKGRKTLYQFSPSRSPPRLNLHLFHHINQFQQQFDLEKRSSQKFGEKV